MKDVDYTCKYNMVSVGCANMEIVIYERPVLRM